MKIGTHGSTYGGNPLACAVAEAVLDVVSNDDVLQGVVKREALFREGLQRINDKYHAFAEIRGKGLLLGAALNEKYKGQAKAFLVAAAEHGLMCLIAGADVVRFTPSLVIPEQDIELGLQRFELAVAQVVKG